MVLTGPFFWGASFAQSPKLLRSENRFDARVSSGAISFSSINIPLDRSSETNSSSATSQQRGVPVGLDLSYTIISDNLNYEIWFGYLKATSLLDRTPGQQSTIAYSRWQHQQYVNYRFHPYFNLGVGIIFKRQNIGDGGNIHTLDTLSVGIQQRNHWSANYQTMASAYYTPLAKFSFADRLRFAPRPVPGAVVQNFGGGLAFHKRWGTRSTFGAEWQHDQSTLQFSSQAAYQSYGFQLNPTITPTQTVTIQTDLFLIAMTRNF